MGMIMKEMITPLIRSVCEWPRNLSVYDEIIDVRSPLEYAADHPPNVSTKQFFIVLSHSQIQNKRKQSNTFRILDSIVQCLALPREKIKKKFY
jgi:rhodanese-related sulfurtransferase